MSGFDDREHSYENKFAHDETLRFKATARRNKLLGLWAAEKMGLAGDDAQTYARELVKIDLSASGEEDIFGKIRADFDARNVAESDHQIRHQMEALMAEATTQIETEGGA